MESGLAVGGNLRSLQVAPDHGICSLMMMKGYRVIEETFKCIWMLGIHKRTFLDPESMMRVKVV